MMRWLALTMLLAAASARAATFPGDASYRPLRCGDDVMTDPLGDQPPSLAERDVVGDSNAPAGLRAGDAQNLYLRIRVDQDPAPAGTVRPFAWGMAFDLDGNRSTYELLVTVDGIAASSGTVSVFTNRTTTLANDPADPADLPGAATATFASEARTTGAGTTIGGNADFFVDIAIPWDILAPLGLDRDTRTYVWVGSSSVANALDGDIACHDGRSGGKATLDGTDSDQTTGDPTRDPGGGGVTGDLRLEGGSGCNTGGSLGLGAALALLGLRRARRPRRNGACRCGERDGSSRCRGACHRRPWRRRCVWPLPVQEVPITTPSKYFTVLHDLACCLERRVDLDASGGLGPAERRRRAHVAPRPTPLPRRRPRRRLPPALGPRGGGRELHRRRDQPPTQVTDSRADLEHSARHCPPAPFCTARDSRPARKARDRDSCD
jgi:hypothetical protein